MNNDLRTHFVIDIGTRHGPAQRKKEKKKKVFEGVNYAIAFNCCVSFFFFFLSIITDNGARYLDSILHSFQ